MNQTAPLLEVADFSCVPPNGRPLFTGLGFSLRPSGAVLLEGGSGQGKSSLLLSLRGIQSSGVAGEGTVLYRGEEITDEHRRAIGLVLQNPHSQMLSTLVEEELRSGRALGAGNGNVAGERNGAGEDNGAGEKSDAGERSDAGAGNDARDLYEDTVGILGLRDLLRFPTRQLSAGQKHMVAIGSIGIIGHPVLLLDEPFLYLDPASSERVLAYVDYLRARGTGVVIASHPEMLDGSRFDRVVRIPRQGSPRSGNGRAEKGRAGILPASFQGREGILPATFQGAEVSIPAPPLSPIPSNLSISSIPSVLPCQGAQPERVIALLNADVGHESRPPLMRGFSLTVRRGEELWIVGPNGSGKTTLLKTLAGQLSPLAGEAVRSGKNDRPRVYLIPQNPDRFFFESTVFQEMLAPLVFANGGQDLKERAQKEVTALLRRLGLEEKADLSPSALSFGERIRLAAAQAALLRPDFLLVDDVLAFCDPDERKVLLDFFRETAARTGCGLVFAASNEAIRDGGGLLVLEPPTELPADAGRGLTSPTGPTGLTGPTGPGRGKRKSSSLRRLFRQTPFEYVPGSSLAHRLPLWVKILLCVAAWTAILAAGARWFPVVALAGTAYYLAAKLGPRRLLVDTQYFVVQTAFFMLLLALCRWNPRAAGEGALRGAQVWLFFLPIAVMMRTSTLDQWMALFRKALSPRKRLALGISLGMLPHVLTETKEVLQAQSLKGFVPRKGYLLRPARLWDYARAVLVPIVLMVEDLAGLAEISVTLRGYDD